MAIKDTKTFAHEVEGKLYQFTVDADSKLHHLQECFVTWIKHVGNIADQAAAAQAAQEPAASEATPTPEATP